jgi:hypothetical protein
MRFARPSARPRASTTPTSIPTTSAPKKSSRKSPRPTTSSRREEAQDLRPGRLLLRPDRSRAGRGLRAPAAALRQPGRPAPRRFRRLRLLGLSRRPRRAGRRALRLGQLQRHLFRHLQWRAAASAAAARPAARHRPRIPGHSRFLDRHPRRPGAHPDQPPGNLPLLPRPGEHRRRASAPSATAPARSRRWAAA